MMTTPQTGPWKVLLVDDEPAVHAVSQLILADLRFEDRAVELLSADSAAQARELLARERGIALVLLDVVMETDDAGMALVQHIREQLGEQDMQIVLRTGQPGMAPEHEIVQGYEINGYVLKTELTAQRLHTIVVAGLRGFRHAQQLRQERSQAPAAAATPAQQQARDTLVQELRAGALGDRALLQVQPELALATHQVRGAELVLSWRSALGLLPANRLAALLPLGAERRALVQWLLEQACAWGRAWRAAGQPALRVSVPLVGDSLTDPAVGPAVLASLAQAGLPGDALDLLVSEASLLDGGDVARAALERLRAAGVSVTLVDFGGQSIALQRLHQQLPDRLKLHRVLVRAVRSDAQRMAMARSVMALAQTLHIVAIADGIGSDDDAQFFTWEGCELGQGDALAPACAPADLAGWLQHGGLAGH
jgi:EAL domain-containing protein (putative c-di-GMP-specific phosphodiesterase class I)